MNEHVAQFERRLRTRPHRHLPGVEFIPRITTSTTNGKRQVLVSDSVLMQLPTPLDCISKLT
jgi:hypothetical protein